MPYISMTMIMINKIYTHRKLSDNNFFRIHHRNIEKKNTHKSKSKWKHLQKNSHTNTICSNEDNEHTRSGGTHSIYALIHFLIRSRLSVCVCVCFDILFRGIFLVFFLVNSFLIRTFFFLFSLRIKLEVNIDFNLIKCASKWFTKKKYSIQKSSFLLDLFVFHWIWSKIFNKIRNGWLTTKYYFFPLCIILLAILM